MTDPSLHPTPRWRDVALEQVRVVGLSLRRETLIAAAILGIVTTAIVVDIIRGNASTWFDSGESSGVALLSFLIPFVIWRRQSPFESGFLWTLPVNRRRLVLAKVFAGLVWVIVAVVGFVLWHRTLAMVSGVTGAKTIPFVATIGATAMYLFGSAFVLGLRHPLRWLLGTAGVFFLVGGVGSVFEHRYGVETLFGSSDLYFATLKADAVFRTLPALAQWAITTFIPIGAGLAALLAAASRHKETR